ncbi:MAG: glycosyltransferase family 39 protein [Gammaproteobacteria bacterium]|nr:MAG: glycosyltransferase family 39 protein [Gammaproteobacteria bacterium]
MSSGYNLETGSTGLSWLTVLIIAILILVGTIGSYPLTDKTEGRYAEIARIMVVTGDWVTPRLEPDVPFWGKPPLEFWLTATSFKVLGFNEFAARLPSLLLMLLTAGLIFLLGNSRNGPESGLASSAIMITTAISFVSAEMVMTDPALVFATTLAMMSFWQAVSTNNRWWGYLFFIGIALGLLAKGPLVLVLVLLPITIWAIWLRAWGRIWRSLPWLTGLFLMIVISLPWYLLAESRTPGFLNYFIIGEHIMRFIDSGWNGDLYGSAHSYPKGMIWLYWLLAALPWSILTIRVVSRWFNKSKKRLGLDDWRLYLLLWGLTPMLFFSLTSNVLPTYVLPAIPALALILGSDSSVISNIRIRHIGWLTPFSILIFIVAFNNVIEGRSQKQVISDFKDLKQKQPLVYFYKRPYSASFYTDGSAILADTLSQIYMYLDNPGTQFFAIKNDKITNLEASTLHRLKLVKKYQRYTMYRKRGA